MRLPSWMGGRVGGWAGGLIYSVGIERAVNSPTVVVAADVAADPMSCTEFEIISNMVPLKRSAAST